MLRVKFQIEPAGYLATVSDRFPEGRSVELDNAIYVEGDSWMEYLTVFGVADDVDPTERLSHTGGCTLVYSDVVHGTAQFLVLVEETEPFLLSTIAALSAVPHRLFVANERLTAIVSVHDWDHLKDLADAVEITYDGFELLGTSQSDLVGFPLGGHRLKRTMQGKLTERQLLILQTAFEMGYFEVPQAVNAQDVAARLEIGQGTLSEQLRNAQHSLLAILFGEGAEVLDGPR